MANVTHKGEPVKTFSDLPKVGTVAPDFKLVKNNLEELSLKDFSGKKIILNIFMGIDTGTCSTSVRKFNEKVKSLKNIVVIGVSMDLPYALKRFCGAEGITEVITASAFRSPDFGKNYGVSIIDGPLTAIFARAIVIIDESRKVIYTEQVQETTKEPDYEKAIAAIEK